MTVDVTQARLFVPVITFGARVFQAHLFVPVIPAQENRRRNMKFTT